MSHKRPPVTIQIVNSAAFSGDGSVIVLELADKQAAIKVAKQIADETGRSVTVRDADVAVIGAIPAFKFH